MASRKIEVQITGSADGLKKALGEAGNHTSKLGSSFAALGKMAVVGLGALGVGAAAAGVKMVGLASDAAEVQSKMEVTFGKVLPGLTKEIDKFAAATGGSRFAMREQVADMGALLAPMLGNKQAAGDMSVKMTELAQDLGSFNNIPTGDALEKIRAGLVGESEPLRSLGVLLSEATTKQWAYTHGIAAKGAVLTETQKVEARAGEIMAQTALAHGDATRTAGSMANQMKALKNEVSDTATELGMKLIPVALAVVSSFNEHWPQIQAVASSVFAAVGSAVTKVTGVLSGHKDMLASVADGAKRFGEFLSRNADIILPLVGAIAGMTAAWLLYTGVTKALAVVQGILNVVLAANPIGLVVLAIAGLVGALVVLYTRSETAHRIIGEAFRGIEQVVAAVVGTVKALWDRFGAGITRVAQATFGAIKGIVGGDLNVVKGIINTVMAVIHGNWGQAWAGIKQILSGAWQSMTAIIRNFGPILASAAMEVGKAIVDGIKGGIEAVWGGLESWVAQKMGDLKDMIKKPWKILSPSQTAHEEIGKPIAEGIIEGLILGLAPLPEKMKASVKTAIEAARAAIDAARGTLSTAWGQLTSDAGSAFDAIANAMLTPAEKALKKLNDTELWAGLNKNLAKAQKDMWDANAVGDPAALTTAWEALQAAETAIEKAHLEVRAAEERKQLDARNTLKKRHFDEALVDLQTSLAAHGATHAQAQKAIIALFKSYGVTYKESGLALGSAFAQGLRESMADVIAAAEAIADEVRRRLKLKSPAEVGPLASLDTWWSKMGATLASGMDTAVIGGTVNRAAAPAFAGGAGGGGAAVYNFSFPNFVGDKRDLENIVTNAVLRSNKRGSLLASDLA